MKHLFILVIDHCHLLDLQRGVESAESIPDVDCTPVEPGAIVHHIELVVELHHLDNLFLTVRQPVVGRLINLEHCCAVSS